MDVLSNGFDYSVKYHIRCKGIPDKCLIKTCEQKYNNNLIKLYEALENGEGMQFDLAEDHVRFKMKLSGIEQVEVMSRTIKFDGDVNYVYA